MAFPSIVATASSRNTANQTSQTVNLPNGSDVVGRRLVVAWVTDNQQAATWPANWNSLGSADGQSGNSRLYVYYHDVDGTEGYPSTGATITLTVATSDGFSSVAFLISGHDTGTAPEATFVGQASTGTDPNPPSITPTGGAKDYLFLAFAGTDGTNGAPTFSGFPANYTLNQVSIASGFNGGTSCGGAGQQLNTAGPEDPSAFTISAAEQREAATVVIHPAGGGGTTFNQNNDGGITPTGALIKQDTKILAGGITPGGALVKAVSRALSGAITPGAGTLVKKASKAFTGTITPGAGSLTSTKVAVKAVTGAITPAGALVNKALKTLAGSITPAGALIKQLSRALAGVLTPGAGALVKTAVKPLSGGITPAGALVKRCTKILAGALTPSGVLAGIKVAVKTLTGGLTPGSGDLGTTYIAAPPPGEAGMLTVGDDSTDVTKLT